MLMLKLIGGGFLVASGAMAGISAASYDERRLVLMTEYTVFLTRASAMVSFSGADVRRILQDSEGLPLMEKLCDSCLEKLENGEELSLAWEGAVEELARKKLILSEDKRLFTLFSQGFGETDAEGEHSRLMLCLEQAKQRREQLIPQTEKNRRLYRLLGSFAGVLAAVLLM